MLKRTVGWLFVALALLSFISTLALYIRGKGETLPHLPQDEFLAYLLGRIAAILVPLGVGLLLLRQPLPVQATHVATLPKQTESNSKRAMKYVILGILWTVALLINGVIIRPIAYDISYKYGAIFGATIQSLAILIGFLIPWWLLTSRKPFLTNQPVETVNSPRNQRCEDNHDRREDPDYAHTISFAGHQSKRTHQSDNTYEPKNPSLNGASPRDRESNDAWLTARAYFPDVEKLYTQLGEIDSELAERFKSDRITLKDFANAQREYWRLLNELAQQVCGSGISNARNFLLTAINNRDFETARRFIALGKALGHDNMNDDVLAQFKTSGGDISQLMGPDKQEEWDAAAKHYPQINKYYEKLRRVSSKAANGYKANLLTSRNFSMASEVFESAVHQIASSYCQGQNSQPREYLQKAILRGKSDIARQFMAFAQKTGPENMDNAAFNKFKRSIDPLWDRDDG